jgi:hypothetical protein
MGLDARTVRTAGIERRDANALPEESHPSFLDAPE